MINKRKIEDSKRDKESKNNYHREILEQTNKRITENKERTSVGFIANPSTNSNFKDLLSKFNKTGVNKSNEDKNISNNNNTENREESLKENNEGKNKIRERTSHYVRPSKYKPQPKVDPHIVSSNNKWNSEIKKDDKTRPSLVQSLIKLNEKRVLENKLESEAHYATNIEEIDRFLYLLKLNNNNNYEREINKSNTSISWGEENETIENNKLNKADTTNNALDPKLQKERKKLLYSLSINENNQEQIDEAIEHYEYLKNKAIVKKQLEDNKRESVNNTKIKNSLRKTNHDDIINNNNIPSEDILKHIVNTISVNKEELDVSLESFESKHSDDYYYNNEDNKENNKKEEYLFDFLDNKKKDNNSNMNNDSNQEFSKNIPQYDKSKIQITNPNNIGINNNIKSDSSFSNLKYSPYQEKHEYLSSTFLSNNKFEPNKLLLERIDSIIIDKNGNKNSNFLNNTNVNKEIEFSYLLKQFKSSYKQLCVYKNSLNSDFSFTIDKKYAKINNNISNYNNISKENDFIINRVDKKMRIYDNNDVCLENSCYYEYKGLNSVSENVIYNNVEFSIENALKNYKNSSYNNMEFIKQSEEICFEGDDNCVKETNRHSVRINPLKKINNFNSRFEVNTNKVLTCSNNITSNVHINTNKPVISNLNMNNNNNSNDLTTITSKQKSQKSIKPYENINTNNNNIVHNDNHKINNNLTVQEHKHQIDYQQNIIQEIDTHHFQQKREVYLDPMFLDILCTNCYNCIKYKEIEEHTDKCIIEDDENNECFEINYHIEENEDYNSKIFKLYESLKAKKTEYYLTGEFNLIEVYEKLLSTVYEIFINNYSLEDLNKQVFELMDIKQNRLTRINSNYQFDLLLYTQRIAQLIVIKSEEMEKILTMVTINKNLNISDSVEENHSSKKSRKSRMSKNSDGSKYSICNSENNKYNYCNYENNYDNEFEDNTKLSNSNNKYKILDDLIEEKENKRDLNKEHYALNTEINDNNDDFRRISKQLQIQNSDELVHEDEDYIKLKEELKNLDIKTIENQKVSLSL